MPRINDKESMRGQQMIRVVPGRFKEFPGLLPLGVSHRLWSAAVLPRTSRFEFALDPIPTALSHSSPLSLRRREREPGVCCGPSGGQSVGADSPASRAGLCGQGALTEARRTGCARRRRVRGLASVRGVPQCGRGRVGGRRGPGDGGWGVLD